MSHVEVMVGAFGSGKTEISINYALKLAAEGRKVALVDLDVVTPYFRSREHAKFLEERGVRVAFPLAPYAAAELPIIPRDIFKYISDPEMVTILDIGGDADGAKVLGSLAPQLPKDTRVNFVINTKRPFTATEDRIKAYIAEIESVSRLKVTDLISNTNLGKGTSSDTILEGWDIVKRVSLTLKHPVRWICVEKELEMEVQKNVDVQVFPLGLKLKPIWEQDW